MILKNSLCVLTALLAFTFFSFAPFSPAAAATDPNSKALDRFFETMNAEQTVATAIRKTVELQVMQNPSLKPIEADLLAFSLKHGSFKSNEKEIRALYADAFTEQEIQDITAFYSSPSGRKAVAMIPEITAKAALLGERKAKAALPGFLKEMKKKLEKAKK